MGLKNSAQMIYLSKYYITLFSLCVISLSICISSNLSAQIKVHGYVIEVTTGMPISDAVIFINDEYNITKDPFLRDTTDSNGYYEIEVNTGTYHFGVYASYKFEDDSFVMVYQPGVFSIPDSSLDFFNQYGFNVNYGLSKVHFETLHYLKYNKESLLVNQTKVVNKILGPAFELTKSRITTNTTVHYRNKPIVYIELKTW